MIWNMRRRGKKLYKWIFNERLNIGSTKTYYIVFYSNGKKFSSIQISRGWVTIMDYDSVRVYSRTAQEAAKWPEGTAYRTVTFTEPPTGEPLTFLQANATPL